MVALIFDCKIVSMGKLISNWITHNNFQGLHHKIIIRNETSHTQFIKPELIIIRELKENGLTLEMPLNVCQLGHNLMLFFLNFETDHKIQLPVTGRFKEAKLEALAKVEHLEINHDKEHVVFVELNFTQIDLELWKNFIKDYATNQKLIDEMMLKQQGEK